MDTADVDESWWKRSSALFCPKCHRLRFPFLPLDLKLDTLIPSRTDMFMADHSLMPLILSARMVEALTTAHAFLHLGQVFQIKDGVRHKMPFFSVTSRRPPVPLRGRNPSIQEGRPVSESERVSVCSGCGIMSRRERSPWYLHADEVPQEPVFCTDLGLAVAQSLGETLKALKLKQVRVERVAVVDH